MIKKIRILPDETNSASANMAFDEALLMHLVLGESPATLRFYQWNFPTVSLGYFQKVHDVNLDLTKEKGWEIVRRPTGGRAVLHWKEVTFCLTIPTQGKGLWEIFKLIHESIGTGLNKLGIPAKVLPMEYEKPRNVGSRKDKMAACFASPSRYELTLNGKKIAGSAQKKYGDFMLIHGSIPIESTYKSLFEIMTFPDEEKRMQSYKESLKKMTSIHTETGKMYEFSELTKAIAQGFKEQWACELIPGKISDSEREMIVNLDKEKYGSEEWLFKK